MSWLPKILSHIHAGDSVCRILIADKAGSVPREIGAQMFVTAETIFETIGGGQLEYQAIAIARKQIFAAESTGFYRYCQRFALGPNLGQCCGGSVLLLFEAFSPLACARLETLSRHPASAYRHALDSHSQICTPIEGHAAPPHYDKHPGPHYDKHAQILIMPADVPRPNLYIYGAGHVGRALIAVSGGLAVQRHWIDVSADRFPSESAQDVTVIPARDMAIIARHAPPKTIHIVMSYAHSLDEDIIYAVLERNDFLHVGLIGSKTKAARFKNMFKARGIDEARLARLHCPIGLPQIKGKSPPHIALSIASQIAIWLDEME